ncbi:glycosyltransferase [Streptomyces sp. SBT349]|uniref:glycosyltransferase n=1 Tax=Streptomyces sp. SBT349 TaxID=1580539 RepID=UPI00066E7434|nr:glycosyltransferase [Streptomyces sp. SBT349]
MPQVTVSVPYHGCPDTVRRAVDAVLAQSHVDLVCVVVNDGDHASPPWPALADIADERLIRLDLPEQRGRYFADAVVLAACSTEWFAVHDADDAAAPGWLAGMLAAAGDRDVVLTAQRVHPLRGRVAVEQAKPWSDGRYRHHAHMAGLWRTSWLRQVGGPRPDWRIAWDTMLTGAALALDAATVVDEPLYDRHRRRGSLTTAPETGNGSAERKQAAARARKLWPDMVSAADSGPEAVGAVLTADVPAELLAEVEQHADRLRRLLAGEPVALTDLPTALDDAALWRGWALDRAGAQVLGRLLAEHSPQTVLEAGSGSSTVLLAEYARDTGARVISLEHQARYRDATAALLAERGLAEHVDLRLAPLRRGPNGPWYDTALPDGVGLALIDGPPEGDGGRAAAYTALAPHMADGGLILLDDAGRPGERAALATWQRQGARVEQVATGGKPMATVRAERPASVGAGDMVLTLLTGDRPELLADTLASLRATAPGLLETARLIVLDNGADPDSADILEEHADVIDVREHRDDRASIGDATSHLATLAAESGRPFWLHLEDDWRATPDHPGWLDAARRILAEHEDVYQVRLRHSEERTLPYHMHTKRRLRWEPRQGWRFAREAHLTTNPNLTRTRDISAVWPASGEREAQARAHAAGLKGVAQLTPGVFVHTGAGSRRAVTKCRA